MFLSWIRFLSFTCKMIVHMYKIYLFLLFFKTFNADTEFCSANEPEECTKKTNEQSRYILYDVNPPEGFNLRRDVYVRLAVFMNNLKNSNDPNLGRFKLVLPPWSDLYHWRSTENNMHIPWSHFFDLRSMQKFAPVVEMYDFFDDVGENYKQINIDEVYILQNFEDMFETGNFVDKMEIGECTKNKDCKFFGYNNITSKNVRCLSFHGFASQLKNILKNTNSKSIMFDHAEIVLHDRYGDRLYWQARRSMRFNKKLIAIANKFRKKYFNSTDLADKTTLPQDWTKEKRHRNAVGGQYLCAHLRRRDFLYGRPNDIPDIKNTAHQLKKLLQKYNLDALFVATDAPEEEFEDLKSRLAQYKVYRFYPTKEILQRYKDGGVAIIDQIICSHAYYFVGTHESTFSFRIQEEREIMGYPVERTFNRLCGNKQRNCESPSAWKIVH